MPHKHRKHGGGQKLRPEEKSFTTSVCMRQEERRMLEELVEKDVRERSYSQFIRDLIRESYEAYTRKINVRPFADE